MRKLTALFACTIALALGGCFFFVSPKMGTPATHPAYRTGALTGGPAPVADRFLIHPITSRLMALPVPAAASVQPGDIAPPIYQLFQDCGPCQLYTVSFAATHQIFSPRASYVWSRQHSMGTNWTADTGTFAYANIWVAQTMGQPRQSVWPYAGTVNEQPAPPAVADAVNYELIPLLTPTVAECDAAIVAGHPVGIYVAATADWYTPTLCADGSYEVRTPTPASQHIGGHFPTEIAYDHARKMLDGTTGGIEILNSWGSGYGNNGKVWLSNAGWVNANSDAPSRYTLIAKTPPTPPVPPLPPIPTGAAPHIYFFAAQYGTAHAGTANTLLMTVLPPNARLLIQPSTGGNPIVASGLTRLPIASPAATTTYTLSAATTSGTVSATCTIKAN